MPSSEGKAKRLGGTYFTNAIRSRDECCMCSRWQLCAWQFSEMLESGRNFCLTRLVLGGGYVADAKIVLTSLTTLEKAEQLASALVERRLAACVNIIGPIRSVYRWKEAIEREQEYLLFIKTTAERLADLATAFAELHPYELPERVELTIDGGSEHYLQWLSAQVARASYQ